MDTARQRPTALTRTDSKYQYQQRAGTGSYGNWIDIPNRGQSTNALYRHRPRQRDDLHLPGASRKPAGPGEPGIRGGVGNTQNHPRRAHREGHGG